MTRTIKVKLVYYPNTNQTGVLTLQGTQMFEVRGSLSETRAHLEARGYTIL